MFEECRWLNEPKLWSLGEGVISVVTDGQTDFWRETHYGFTRHSGHAYLSKIRGDFTAELRVRGRYEALYDQAGLMVLVDDSNWVKAGIEHSDGQASLGSVLTREHSDWATGPFEGDPGDFHLRMTVSRGVLRIQVSKDGLTWPLVRLCPFPQAASCLVGPMTCSPSRAGLQVEFSRFHVTAPVGRELHDLG